MVFWYIVKQSVGKQNNRAKEPFTQETPSPRTGNVIDYYISLSGLEKYDREQFVKWLHNKLFEEVQGEYLARLYSLGSESAGYIAQKLWELKDKNPETYNTYKELLDKILKNGYIYFLIGLKEALDREVVDRDNICYALLATLINIILDFREYLKPKQIINMGHEPDDRLKPRIIVELTSICSENELINCLKEKIDKYDTTLENYRIDRIFRYLASCNAPLEFYKYLSKQENSQLE